MPLIMRPVDAPFTHAILFGLLSIALSFGCASSPIASGPPEARTADFADALADAVSKSDASAAAALFSDQVVASLLGTSEAANDRSTLEACLAAFFARKPNAKFLVGRTWTDRDAAVIEFVITGTIAARLFGVPGAAVVRFDEHHRAKELRIYLDLVTVRAQLAPELLPPGMRARATAIAPLEGTTALSAKGSDVERKNLELTNQIWAALDAHDAAAVLEPSADNYIYEDYCAPGPMNKLQTQEMVAGFLHAVADFRLVDKPVQIAAGNEVVTEMVENAKFKDRPLVLHALDIKRFEAGRVIKEWQYSNYDEVIAQTQP